MRVLIGVLVALVGAVAGAAIGFALTYALLSGEDGIDALTWVAAVVFFCVPCTLGGAVAAGVLFGRRFPGVLRGGIGARLGYGIGAAALVLVVGPPVAIELAAGSDDSARDLLEGELCTKPGIRYVGETPRLTVCFTLSEDRSERLEVGWRFGRGSGCEGSATYSEGEVALAQPGRIAEPGFTADIRGARAAGTLTEPEVCTGESFEWTARRAS